MKLLYALTLLTIVTACESKQKPKANFHLPFRKDSLVGNWMIISLKPEAGYDALPDSVFDPIKEKIVLTAYSFLPNGSLIIDTGGVERTGAQWIMNSTKQLFIAQPDSVQVSTPFFKITKYENDSLTLENMLQLKKEMVSMRYVVRRLRDNDSVPNLFEPALNKWRQRPSQPEDDAAIKTRMKQVLYYYSAYFANIKGNQIPVFSTQKILCPIKFYSGGIGMKKFKADDEWTNIFYNKDDARKAHKFLDDAFTDISGYPEKGGDYVWEYIIALKLVADLL